VSAPHWTRAIVGALGLTTLVFGALCFFASPLLFGVDAYRTLARVPIGLLGAAALGLGAAGLLVAVKGEPHGMRSLVIAMFVTAAFVPPVVGFNIGAFDRIDTSGAPTLTVVLAFVALVATPLHACLLVLNRLVKSGGTT
jgi:hypothetical protein